MKYLFTILIGLLLAQPVLASFSYYTPITIKHAQIANTVAENYTNFPVEIASTTLNTLKTATNGGHFQNSSGYDVGFYTASDCVTGKLSAERDNYSSTTPSNDVWWIREPTISTTSDTTLYMCYGDASVSTDPNLNTSYGATSTWDSTFNAVYHFGNGSALSVKDSTKNNNSTAATNTASASTSPIGGGAWFSTTTAQIDITPSSTPAGGTHGTFSVWADPLTYSGLLIGQRHLAGSLYGGMDLALTGISTTTQTSQNGSTYTIAINPAYSLNAWQYFVITEKSNADIVYLNGVSIGTTTGASFSGNGTGQIEFGTGMYGGGYKGTLDEARISTKTQTPDWVKTEYNNQSSPQTFETFGTETSIGGGATIAPPNFFGVVLSGLGRLILSGLGKLIITP